MTNFTASKTIRRLAAIAAAAGSILGLAAVAAPSAQAATMIIRPNPNFTYNSCVPADYDLPVSNDAAIIKRVEAATACLLYQARTGKTPSTVVNTTPMGNSARAHSQDQARVRGASHTGTNGSNPDQRIQATSWCNYACYATGEIMYWGVGSSATARAAVNWWLNSPGHRAHVVRGFTADGVGIAFGSPRGATGGTFTVNYSSK